jgi:hypothetical protein
MFFVVPTTRAALLCATVALLTPAARAVDLPELSPDTDPVCAAVAERCKDSFDPNNFLSAALLLYTGGLDEVKAEVRKIIAKEFQNCMETDSCCCCDANVITAFSEAANDLSAYKQYMPDDIATDPMQCSHRTGGSGAYTCDSPGAACPVLQSCSAADVSFSCTGDAVKDDANHCATDTCDASDFGGADTRCCSAPGSCSGVAFECTDPAVRYDSGTCAKATCGLSDFGSADANCCQSPPQKCKADEFIGECTGGTVKDDSGTCSTSKCGPADFGTADANCCTTRQSCGAAGVPGNCTGSAVKDDSGTCAGAVCLPADFGTADANCCRPPPQSCGAAGVTGNCTDGAVKDDSGTCSTGTCGSADFGTANANCCRPPPQSCSEAKSKFKCDAPAVKDVAGTCAETVCKISDFGEATANCCKLPPPEYGWRVKINATWTGTNCKKVLSLIPILKSRPEFKEMAPLVEDDALSCIDFGGCVDNV